MYVQRTMYERYVHGLNPPPPLKELILEGWEAIDGRVGGDEHSHFLGICALSGRQRGQSIFVHYIVYISPC
jgi:hypothetical protein